MGKFEYVTVLLSFVFALALTHVLSRAGAMMLARERVRFSGLLALAMLNAVVQVFIDWLGLWDYRGMKEWSLLTIIVIFLLTVAIYFVCAAAVPDTDGEAPIDMEAFYWKNRRLYYALWLVLLIVSIAVSLLLAGTNPLLALEEALGNLPFFVPVLLALLVRARWAQWAGGISLLVLSVAWPVVFSKILS